MLNRKPKESEEESSAVVYQTLALFIILLSFFVILNSISTFEKQKAVSIMQSIEEAFTTKIFKDDIAPSQSPDALRLAGEGQAVETLEKLFKSSFPQLTEVRTDTARGRFYAELPLSELENIIADFVQRKENATDNAPPENFFEYVLDIYKRNNATLRLEFYILSDTPLDKIDSTNLLEQRLFLSDAAATFGRAGLPPQNLSIGFEEGETGMARLIISNAFTYNPASPTTEGDTQ
ncbi:MAG: hypothetical protein CMH25_03520 [Micavibrio sp.]|nr:hypothetical protein [Micavibrio sp.]|tara:strand:+ start:691137 stop:691841 length:705 start_codon:yes stop_codon:yes gene_type:complete